jgi:hypothetical protein
MKIEIRREKLEGPYPGSGFKVVDEAGVMQKCSTT